ncbi:MAG: hypothetical protein IPP98_15655 [Gemmatimonadetes bacterium]|jgi:hypothetical protein|nr:hypothetical protein [Gemmatimonadota bacterium]
MDASPVVTWKIPIEGDPSDLENLAVALESREVGVTRFEGGFALSLSTSIAGLDYAPVRSLAEEHLAAVNGVGKILDPAFRALRLTGRLLGVDAAGRTVHTVMALQGIEIRVRLGTAIMSINGIPQADPRTVTASAVLDGALTSSLAWDALAVIGRDEPTWSELYFAYELVESGTNGRVAEVCGATKAELELFCHTANSYRAIGRESRHGTTDRKPPATPMSHRVATRLVRRVVEAWLRHLGRKPAC